MGFWNDEIKFVTQIEWKQWIQNVCESNVKMKIEKKSPSNENFQIKMHRTFSNTRILDLK
jgi:hypothetical protein